MYGVGWVDGWIEMDDGDGQVEMERKGNMYGNRWSWVYRWLEMDDGRRWMDAVTLN